MSVNQFKCLRTERVVIDTPSRRGVRQAMFDEDPSCRYCGVTFTSLRRSTLDHIRPTCQGGTTNPDNLTLCCPRCNVEKSDRNLLEWRDLLRRQLRSVEAMLSE